MSKIRILKISLIILISVCFITTFSFMAACKEATPVEVEEDSGEVVEEEVAVAACRTGSLWSARRAVACAARNATTDPEKK